MAASFSFGPWEVYAVKSHILKSDEVERFTNELQLPQLPEMTFGENILRLQHTEGFGIEFNAIKALSLVDNKNDLLKVAAHKDWYESRKNHEFINKTIQPFDWTYTTNYKGTLFGEDKIQVSTTTDQIDIEKLKTREKIAYFENIVLFEDELADHGAAELTVKIRIMPSCFLILQRFFLRVDGLLFRIHDTRIYHEPGTNHFIREYCEKEQIFSKIPNLSASSCTDSTKIDEHLIKKFQSIEKISFISTSPNGE